MKKTLLILSLFFAAQSAFSGNSTGSGLQDQIQSQCNENINTSFNVDLGDGYMLAGTVTKTETGAYYYMGTLIHSDMVVGTVWGSFQVEVVNGVERLVAGSATESYSNEETAAVVKAKKDGSVKNSISNVR